MAIWLIDSRGRVSDGKRLVWSWDDIDINAYREAWDIVLRAEVRQEQDRKDYEAHYDQDMHGIDGVEANELAESFNNFWSYYGWHMMFVDDEEDHGPAHDIVIVPPATAPRETFTLWEPEKPEPPQKVVTHETKGEPHPRARDAIRQLEEELTDPDYWSNETRDMIAGVMASYDISDDEWDRIPRDVQRKLIAPVEARLLERGEDDIEDSEEVVQPLTPEQAMAKYNFSEEEWYGLSEQVARALCGKHDG